MAGEEGRTLLKMTREEGFAKSLKLSLDKNTRRLCFCRADFAYLAILLYNEGSPRDGEVRRPGQGKL